MKIASMVLFILLVAGSLASARIPASLEAEPIPRFVAPPIAMETLSNGLTLYLVPDRTLPLVRFYALIGYGSVADPPGREGEADLLMTALRMGGTDGLSPDDLDAFLGSRAATLSAGAEPEYAFVEVRGLAADQEELLRLFFDVLRRPRWNPKVLQSEKDRFLEAVRRQYDNPFDLASLMFRRLLYGRESRWAALPTRESVKRLRRTDLIEGHRRFFVPSNIRLLVWGDWDQRLLIDRIKKLAGDWQGAPVQFPYPPLMEEKRFRPGIFLVPRNIPQPVIIFGHLGERRFSPEKYNLLIGNWILGGGGGTTSRLGRTLREAKGFAYMVGSRCRFPTEYGPCDVYLQTSEEKAPAALGEALSLFRDFVSQTELAPHEIEEAKQAFVASLLFETETTFGYALKSMQYDYFGFPPRYLEIFRDETLRVKKQGIIRSLRTVLKPDDLTIVVVGNPKALKKPLEAWGKVQILKPN